MLEETLKPGDVYVHYHHSDASPIYSWEHFPDAIFADNKLADLSELVLTVAEDTEAIVRFPIPAQEIISELAARIFANDYDTPMEHTPPIVDENTSENVSQPIIDHMILNPSQLDMEVTAEQHPMQEEVFPNLSLSPRQLLLDKSTRFTTYLLKQLSDFGYDSMEAKQLHHPISESIDKIIMRIKCFQPYEIKSINVNNRIIETPDSILVQSGNQFRLRTHLNVFTGFEKEIVTVPDFCTHATKLNSLFVLFPGDPNNQFLLPGEPDMKILELVKEQNQSVYARFSAFERYLTIMHYRLQQFASFVAWAESDPLTAIPAKVLRERYDKIVTIEMKNFTTPIGNSEISLLEHLSSVSLPWLETPSINGRATGYITIEDHEACVISNPNHAKRDLETWQQEIAKILYDPLMALDIDL